MPARDKLLQYQHSKNPKVPLAKIVDAAGLIETEIGRQVDHITNTTLFDDSLRPLIHHKYHESALGMMVNLLLPKFEEFTVLSAERYHNQRLGRRRRYAKVFHQVGERASQTSVQKTRREFRLARCHNCFWSSGVKSSRPFINEFREFEASEAPRSEREPQIMRPRNIHLPSQDAGESPSDARAVFTNQAKIGKT